MMFILTKPVFYISKYMRVIDTFYFEPHFEQSLICNNFVPGYDISFIHENFNRI